MPGHWPEPQQWFRRSMGVEHPEEPAENAGRVARPMTRRVGAGVLTGAAALLVLATLAWLVFQTKWFGTRLGISMTRGFWRAVISYVECLAVFLALVWLFGGKDM